MPNETDWGGKRSNAGRKPGFGPFGESTVQIRIPASLKNEITSVLMDIVKLARMGKLKELLEHVKYQIDNS